MAKPGQQRRRVRRSLTRLRSNSAGFSQLELLVTLAITGTLALILAPSWTGLIDAQALNHARDAAYQAMRTAQDKAESNRIVWQTSFRDTPQGVQIATHPANALPHEITWSTLSSGSRIDTVNTTLFQSSGIYRVQFGYQGSINGQMGRLTFQRGDRAPRRCVVTSGLLGVLRKADNQDCNRQ